MGITSYNTFKFMKLKPSGDIGAWAAAGIVVSLLAIGVAGSLASNSSKTKHKIIDDYGDDKVFSVGEHEITVKIEDPTIEIKEYEGHVGYEPVSIQYIKDEKTNDYYGELLFVNTADVSAESTGVNSNGEKIYEDFGTPIKYEYKLYDNVYAIGEDIITIPCNSNNPEIEYHDGYAVKGIFRKSYGMSQDTNDGCILYVNSEKVKDEKNKALDVYFKTPIEKQKVLEKQL